MDLDDYKHEWQFQRRPSLQEWAGIVKCATNLMRRCPWLSADGSQLRGEIVTYTESSGVEREVLVVHDQPRIVDHQDGVPYITFNGLEPLAGEALALRFDTDKHSIQTFKRPYDDLVMALFILIFNKFPDLLSVGGTAAPKDWDRGMRAARHVEPDIIRPSWAGPEGRIIASVMAPAGMDFRA